jgi:hypothetical protein
LSPPSGYGRDLYEPVVLGEQATLDTEGDHRRGSCNGTEYQVHDCRLNEYGIERAGSGQDKSGHGTREDHEADCLGRFDLRDQRCT